MFRLLFFVVFILFSVSCAAPVQIAPTRTTFESIEYSFPAQPLTNPIMLAAKRDLIAFHERDTKLTKVFRRNDTGQYQHIVSRMATNTTTAIRYTATDGNWVAWMSVPFQSGQTLWCEFFIPNDDGTVSGFTTFDSSVAKFNYGDFLSDGSFVGISPDVVYTYRYINATWTLISTSNFTKTMAIPFVGTAAGPFFQFTDTHLITITKNYAEIHFYERQANDTWSLSDNFTTGATRLGAAAWNGNDTVIASYYGYNNEAGIMYIYTKVDGTWSVTSTTLGQELDWLGTRVVSVDVNTFLVGMYKRTLLLQRNNGTWFINGDFIGETSVNSYDIFISQPDAVYIAPLCSVNPVIDYTCDKTALDTCKFQAFDASLVCEYNAKCGDSHIM